MGEQIEGKFRVASYEDKQYDKKKDGQPTGEKGHIYKATIQPEEGGRGLVLNTFSESASKVFSALKESGAIAVFKAEEDKPFNNVMQYAPLKIASAEGEVLYDAAADKASNKPRSNYQGKGGGSGPEWGYRTPEERTGERISIESQVALKASVETLSTAAQFAEDIKTSDDMLAFVQRAFDQYVVGMRSQQLNEDQRARYGKPATEQSGSGPRPQVERTQGSSTSATKSRRPEQGSPRPDTATATADRPADRPSRPESVPQPDPDSSAATGVDARKTAIAALDDMLGGRGTTAERLKARYGKETYTTAELEAFMAEVLEEQLRDPGQTVVDLAPVANPQAGASL